MYYNKLTVFCAVLKYSVTKGLRRCEKKKHCADIVSVLYVLRCRACYG